MSAVGKQPRCPHSDGQSHAESRTEAAQREASGGNLAVNAGGGSSPEGAQPAGTGAVNNKLIWWGLSGKLMRDNKRQWLTINTRIRSLERPPAMCAMPSTWLFAI